MAINPNDIGIKNKIMDTLDIIYKNNYSSHYNEKNFNHCYIDSFNYKNEYQTYFNLENNKKNFIKYLKIRYDEMIIDILLNKLKNNNEIINKFINYNNNSNQEIGSFLDVYVIDKCITRNKINLFCNYLIDYKINDLNISIKELKDNNENLNVSIKELKDNNENLNNSIKELKKTNKEINMTNYIYSSSCVCLVIYNLFNYFFI